MTINVQAEKDVIRQRVWAALEAAQVVEPGVAGHIPAFKGMEEAAARLGKIPAWHAASIVQANPDRAQQPVRLLAMEAGKIVYMAVPKLAEALPFYELDPQNLLIPPLQASTHEEAARIGRQIGLEDLRPIDFVVCGSVVISTNGARLGKGAGYSDIELALLANANLLTEQTVIATTVHELQVVPDDLPEADHDFRVDLIVTPERVITTQVQKRSRTFSLENLSPEQFSTIPVLADRVRRQKP